MLLFIILIVVIIHGIRTNDMTIEEWKSEIDYYNDNNKMF